jgi:hypothetical protein
MAHFVAGQIGVAPSDLEPNARRDETRREIMAAYGFRHMDSEETAAPVRWLTPIAQVDRRPSRLIPRLVDEMRRRRVLFTPFLQHPYTIPSKRLAGRALVERLGRFERAVVADSGIARGQLS